MLEKIDRLEQRANEGELPDAVPGDGASPSDSSSTETSDGATTTEAPEEDSAAESTDAAAEPVPDHGSESNVVSTPSEETPSSEQEPPDALADKEMPATTAGPEAADEDSPTATEEDDAPPRPDHRREDETEDRNDPGSGAEPGSDPSVEYNDLFGPPALKSDDPSAGTDDTDATGGRTSAESSGGQNDGSAQAAMVAEAGSERSSTATDDGLAAAWPRIVQAVKEEHISLGSLLREAEPVECTAGTLTVTVPRDLHRDSLRDRKRVLLQHVAATVEQSIEEIRFVVETTTDSTEADAGASDEPLSPREQLQQLRNTYPVLDVLFTDFGAEPVW